MIIALEEARHKLIDLREDVAELENALRIKDLKAKAAELLGITREGLRKKLLRIEEEKE